MASIDKDLVNETATIQIANGQLNNKLKLDTLREGELFWLTRNTNEINKDYVWSDGELYIGNPDLNGSDPLLIGGYRSGRSLVYKGDITSETSIQDEKFKYARIGDFWRFAYNASGSFKEENFYKDDFIVITDAQFDKNTGITYQETIKYIRVNNSFSSEAALSNIIVNNKKYKATNLEEALSELKETKFEFSGSIRDSEHLNTLIVTQQLKSGSAWRLESDIILRDYDLYDKVLDSYNLHEVHTGYENEIWLCCETGWKLVAKRSNAKQVNYTPNLINNLFDDQHLDIEAITNVQSALDYVINNKAQLDNSGKILVSQIPTDSIASFEYSGKWNPLVSIDGIDNPEFQNSWPTVTENGKKLHNGSFFIVSVDNISSDYDNTIINIQYKDKTSLDLNGSYTKTIELNDGDWIVYSGISWTKIDNSDKITGLKFRINGIIHADNVVVTDPITELKTGLPDIRADHKLAIYKDGQSFTIGGVRLIDQDVSENGLSNYIPKYKKGNKNTLTNSPIEIKTDISTNKDYVNIHSNLQVGDYADKNNITVYGDISLNSYTSENKPTIKIDKTIIKSSILNTDIELTLPSLSGTLALKSDILELNGTNNIIPIFNVDENNIVTLNNSVIKYSDTNEISSFIRYNINQSSSVGLNPIDFYSSYFNKNNDLIISSNVLIGNNESDFHLHISKGLSIGHHDGQNVFFLPRGQLFNDDINYKESYIYNDKWSIKQKNTEEVFISLPATSGVMLTSNSIINGGEYVSNEDKLKYTILF